MPDPGVRGCISNTSPLFYLHQIGCLRLIQQLYDQVFVTPEVVEELRQGEINGEDVPDVHSLSWIVIRQIQIPGYLTLIPDLGKGESSIVALALEMSARIPIIMDDKLGRAIARLHLLKISGTAGLLMKAKQRGLISAVKPLLCELKDKGFWLHERTVLDILALVGET